MWVVMLVILSSSHPPRPCWNILNFLHSKLIQLGLYKSEWISLPLVPILIQHFSSSSSSIFCI